MKKLLMSLLVVAPMLSFACSNGQDGLYILNSTNNTVTLQVIAGAYNYTSGPVSPNNGWEFCWDGSLGQATQIYQSYGSTKLKYAYAEPNTYGGVYYTTINTNETNNWK